MPIDQKPLANNKPRKSYRPIYEALKEEIMLGMIKLGDSLHEVEIAQRFGSSRAPVREALIHLFKEGFLRSADYKGYIAPDISTDRAATRCWQPLSASWPRDYSDTTFGC